MNLHEKLLEIQKEVKYLRKDNDGYQYQYVSSSQTLAKVRAKMDEIGVMLIPSVKGKQVLEYQSKREGNLFLTGLDMSFTWINVENPAETLTVEWYAQGSDSGERGVGKAYTYGEKYFLLKFFHIATDKDDPDAFQTRRVEAGKRTKKTGTIPPQAPPPTEAPPDKLKNGNEVPANPWIGKLVNLTKPITGTTDGRAWTYWEIETPEMVLTTFDKGIAEVAANAIQDHLEVEIIWKLKRSKKTGDEKCVAEDIHILESSELDNQFRRAAGY